MTDAVTESNEALTVCEAARAYLRKGWYPIPIPAKSKGPIFKGWQDWRIAEADLAKHFPPGGNIGLILGEPSGWLVDVDLDCPEARELADEHLPATPAITGRPSAPRSHRWYIAEGATTKKHQDPRTRAMIVELRSTGCQTVVGPSIHPSGETYDSLRATPAAVSYDELRERVETLSRLVIEIRYGAGGIEQAKPIAPRILAPFTGSQEDVERRAIKYLEAMPPAISGSGGHNATFAAATALVHGFGLSTDRALGILASYYNPRCQPEWTEGQLRHKVESAEKTPHREPRGWLRDKSGPDFMQAVALAPVDLSGIIEPRPRKLIIPKEPELLIDESKLRVPGFISEVMDACLEAATFPNVTLAFCGALALLATLTGRKIRDETDIRTNIYLLALAEAGEGKNKPREVNDKILRACGMGKAALKSFASAEGIQDALAGYPVRLFQNDEIDNIVQAFTEGKEYRYAAMMAILLTMFSDSHTQVTSRVKAGKDEPETIDQPHLVLFGTAVPDYYFGALSSKLLDNGFFARTIIIQAPSGITRHKGRILAIPPRVIETARWWADFMPINGNLADTHPEPLIVKRTDYGEQELEDVDAICDAESKKATANNDPMAKAVWKRAGEQIRKLALIRAASVSHKAPEIDADAIKWASEIILDRCRKMIALAKDHVSESPFHAQWLKALRTLKKAEGQTMAHSQLLKVMRLSADKFKILIDTMQQAGDIEPLTAATPGRDARLYRLLDQGADQAAA